MATLATIRTATLRLLIHPPRLVLGQPLIDPIGSAARRRSGNSRALGPCRRFGVGRGRS